LGVDSLGLTGGRNLVKILNEDAVDHNYYVEYATNDANTPVEIQRQLNQRGAGFNYFVVRLTNTGGTLQVRIGDDGLNTSSYTDSLLFSNASAETIPDVDSGTGFGTVGAGRVIGAEQTIVLNTISQIASEQGALVGSVRTNNGVALSVYLEWRSRNIGGVTQIRPEINIRRADTDAPFAFNTTNFTSGEYVQIPIMGFIR